MDQLEFDPNTEILTQLRIPRECKEDQRQKQFQFLKEKASLQAMTGKIHFV